VPTAEQQSSAAAPPLVSIGIPTYNRPVEVQRAVRSVLAQTYGEVEVVVSDDASPHPDVASVLRSLAAVDHRVRVMSQPHNLGHAANYQRVLDVARGEFFMWLADDDWIEPDYVQRCLAVLRDDPSAGLVCGLAIYYRDSAVVVTERPLELRSSRPGLRVLRYYARVTMNGALFGVARRQDLAAVGFRDEVGGDWLLVGAMAGRAAVRTLTDVHIHRSAEGLGHDSVKLAQSFGLSGLRAQRHHLFVAGRLWRAIINGPPFFPGLPAAGRLTVATAAAVSIVVRFTLADLVRSVLGTRRAARLEGRVSAWLRADGD
jgi:glycosyltransferase involved in cell wall biosynthesis